MKPELHLSRRLVWILSFVLWSGIALDLSTAAQTRRASKKRSNPTRQYTFVGPDRDFSIVFPAKPSPSAFRNEGPLTDIRQFELLTEDGKYFSVNFQDIGGARNSRDANEFEANAESTISTAARERGERVISIRRFANNIIEMNVSQPAQDGLNLDRIDRYIVRRGRVYSLGCGSLIDRQEVDAVTCRTFFNSIRFTK